MTNAPARSAIHSAVANYYAEKLAAHGATARGVDWRDAASHTLRHRQFDRLVGGDGLATIADLGCGYGDYFAYLRAQGHHGRYVGYDLVPEMLAAAAELHGSGDDRQWRSAAKPTERADYVIASGIFNVMRDASREDWERYIGDTIGVMADASERGFGFNVLTSWSDAEKRRPDLYYADPAMWFDFCARRFGRRIALLQDYGLYEFTLLCIHEAPGTSA